MGKFVESNVDHYELPGSHFSRLKGYDAYAKEVLPVVHAWARERARPA